MQLAGNPKLSFPWLFLALSACDCAGTFYARSPRDAEGEEKAPEPDENAPERQQELSAEPDGDPDAIGGEVDPMIDDVADDEEAVRCVGEYAYIHGDLWPMWYNMRVACDPEHRALWRCGRIHGEGSTECSLLSSRYETCTSTWGSPWPCVNWGVCAPIEGTVCTAGEPDLCDTRTFDYDSGETWGSYYGRQWGSHTDLHRFLTIHVKDAGGNLIAAFSARPGSEEAYMGGLENFGVGPDPQGFIQIIRDGSPEKFTDKFGSFACIRVHAGEPIILWAAWMNEFCHTCATDYESFPDTPCWTDEMTMTFEGGKHYFWSERGIEPLEGCAGPPSPVAERLPEAACDTSGS